MIYILKCTVRLLDTPKRCFVNLIEEDYDGYGYDYDDYSKQVYDLPGNLDAFNDMYGIKLQGLRK